nr:protein FAM149A [Columba livia]
MFGFLREKHDFKEFGGGFTLLFAAWGKYDKPNPAYLFSRNLISVHEANLQVSSLPDNRSLQSLCLEASETNFQARPVPVAVQTVRILLSLVTVCFGVCILELQWQTFRKGLSRGSTNQCLSGKSGESLPVLFERNVQEAINNYTCETLSSSGHTTPTELNNSWSGINSYTTGLSTERSSVDSWRDDVCHRNFYSTFYLNIVK